MTTSLFARPFNKNNNLRSSVFHKYKFLWRSALLFLCLMLGIDSARADGECSDYAYRIIYFDSPISANMATGLPNDTVVRSVDISWDQGGAFIGMRGEAAQTYGEMVQRLNDYMEDNSMSLDGSVEPASAAIENGNIKVSSPTSGINSSVTISDVDLLSNLNDYSHIGPLVKSCYINPAPSPSLASPPSSPASFDSQQVLPGEFDVNASGQATYSIPITHAPTGGGFGPNISLEYNSGSGNGLAGYGASLGGLGKITRCRQTKSQDGVARPIRWNAQDRYCLNGARLLVETGSYGAPGSTYRTEIDRHLKVTAQGGSTGHPDHFQVEYKNGITEVYDVKHRVSSGSSTRLYAWYLGKKEDSAGNKMRYSYLNPGGGAVPRISIIDYAYDRQYDEQSATMEFFWEERPDPISGYVSGYYYENRYRLKEIYSDGTSGMKYQLHYSGNNGYGGYYEDKLSRLVEVSHCRPYTNACGRPVKFEWPIPSDPSLRTDIETQIDLIRIDDPYSPNYVMGDISGNGLPDIVWSRDHRVSTAFASVNSAGKVSYTVRSVVGDSIGLTNSSQLHLVDYDGDGRMDLATRAANLSGPGSDMKVFFSRPQTDGTWALETLGAVTLSSGENNIHWIESSFVDVNGDGLIDTVDRLHKRVITQKPDQFGSYYPQADIVFNNQGAPSGLSTIGELLPATGDFNGDGTVDFLVSTNLGVVAYTSEAGSSGQLTLKYMGLVSQNMSFNTETYKYHAQVVDLNGDGLSDVVYQESSEIRYRLSKGTGGFSPVKTMPMQTQWRHTAFVDRNADGYLDAVELTGNTAATSMRLSIRFWDPEINAFSSQTSTPLPFEGFPETFSMRDANGDGTPDVIAGLFVGDSLRVIPGGDLSVGNRIASIHRTDNLQADIEIAYQNLGQSRHYSVVNKLASSDTQQVCQSTEAGNTCWNREVAAPTRSELRSRESNPFSGPPGSSQIIEETAPFHRVFNVKSSMPVVTEVSRRLAASSSAAPGNVSIGVTPVTSYYYEQGKMQASGRGFLGFKKLVEVDRRTGVRKATTFRQDWPFTGRPYQATTYTRSGTALHKTETEWALADCNAVCLSDSGTLYKVVGPLLPRPFSHIASVRMKKRTTWTEGVSLVEK